MSPISAIIPAARGGPQGHKKCGMALKISRMEKQAVMERRAGKELAARDLPMNILPQIKCSTSSDPEVQADLGSVSRAFSFAVLAFMGTVDTTHDDPIQRSHKLALKYGKRWRIKVAARVCARQAKESDELQETTKSSDGLQEASKLQFEKRKPCREKFATDPGIQSSSPHLVPRPMSVSARLPSKMSTDIPRPVSEKGHRRRRLFAPVETEEFVAAKPPEPLKFSDFPPLTPRRSHCKRPCDSHYDYFAHKFPDGLQTPQSREGARLKIKSLGVGIYFDAQPLVGRSERTRLLEPMVNRSQYQVEEEERATI